MALARPRSEYQDPAKIMQANQEKTCVGCLYELTSLHSARVFCAKLREHGKRCIDYVEKRK